MSSILITTFGVLHGAAPEGDALSVDLRKALRNPHDDPAMRYLTGLNERVREHVLTTPGAEQVITDTIRRMMALNAITPDEGVLNVHVFCQGGRHRSVAIAEEISARLLDWNYEVGVVHRDIDKPVVQKTPESGGGSSLWAAFAADRFDGRTRMARTLRTMAAFIDLNPVLDTSCLTVWGDRGSVDVSLNTAGLDMLTRAEAVALVTEALNGRTSTHTYDDGKVIVNGYADLSDDRYANVHATFGFNSVWAEPENTAVAS